MRADVGAQEGGAVAAPPSVFVSYAHEDRRWVDELTLYLAPRIRAEQLRLWDDSQIPAGADWRTALDEALDNATVSVLLVTQALLASSFVADVEIPTILARRAQQQTQVIWVPVNHSTVQQSPLWGIDAPISPSRPLAALSVAKRAAAWVEVVDAIDKAATLHSVATALGMVDDTAEPFQALVEGRLEDPGRTFRLVASYQPSQDRITFTGGLETITYTDLDRLPPSDRQFIRDLEGLLKADYQRWLEIRGSASDAGDDAAREVERRIGRSIAGNLSTILDFLATAHKYALDDHYSHYRYIAGQL